jgi:hypothetical protein
MAPAVSRRPQTTYARVPHGLVHVRCVWDEEIGFVPVLRPCPIGIIPPVPHAHLHAIRITRTSGLGLGILKKKQCAAYLHFYSYFVGLNYNSLYNVCVTSSQ